MLFNLNDDCKTLIKKNTILRDEMINAGKNIEELVFFQFIFY